MSADELRDILKNHLAWLHEGGGSRANLSEADLSSANLRGANLSEADLRWANLSKAGLSSANLRWANLSWANLGGANLSKADLGSANLGGANLSKADLGWANLSEADLRKADLRGANLSEADLRWANLSKADLSSANLRWANLSEADLSEAAMPSPDAPTSLGDAARKVRAWLSGRWIQGTWIQTPGGAYSGSCKACLHGAVVYIGGAFGIALSLRLSDAGFDTRWNDQPGRTEAQVLAALDSIICEEANHVQV